LPRGPHSLGILALVFIQRPPIGGDPVAIGNASVPRIHVRQWTGSACSSMLPDVVALLLQQGIGIETEGTL